MRLSLKRYTENHNQILKSRIAAIFLLLLLFAPANVLAQSALVLPEVEVDLWPEYDDPGMLVIYRISLPAEVSLPHEVKLRLPSAAGKPNAVAARQPDGSLVNLTYEQQPNGEWSLLTLMALTTELQVEYYDPNLQKASAQRSYRYQWPGDYGVGNFSIQIQQPVGASGMTISPDNVTQGVQGQDGLTYYTKNIGQVPAGMPFDLQIGYTKAGDELSVSSQQVESVRPIEPAPAGMPNWLPWLLGIFGVGLIAGSIFWYVRSNQMERKPQPARARHKPAAQKAPAEAARSGPVYCSQCGKRAMEGDRFCRTCGAELRI